MSPSAGGGKVARWAAEGSSTAAGTGTVRTEARVFGDASFGGWPINLLELLSRPAWMADALCRERPEVNWFPERAKGVDLGAEIAAARSVCARCLVRDECLAFAVQHKERGVWGGTSEQERQALRKSRAA
jgi:WhiB family transcriptional regulator, redox-sensing transcriptional regulator